MKAMKSMKAVKARKAMRAMEAMKAIKAKKAMKAKKARQVPPRPAAKAKKAVPDRPFWWQVPPRKAHPLDTITAKLATQAKNDLEEFCDDLRLLLHMDKPKGTLEDGDKQKIEAAVQNAREWIEGKEISDKERFESKKQELKDIFNQIFLTRHQMRGQQQDLINPTRRARQVPRRPAADGIERYAVTSAGAVIIA